MQKLSKTRLVRGLFLDRDIERCRTQLIRFHPFFMRQNQGQSYSLADFDRETEHLMSEVFGEASELLEAYEYAKLGEAASLINLPEEAQENGMQDVERESLQQRKRVLEICITELEALRSHRAMTDARVTEYMSTAVRGVSLDATLREAGSLLERWKVGSLLVQNGSRYIGIITDTDLSRKGVAQGLDPSTTTVSTCMTKPVISIEGSEAISTAITLMKEHGIRHLIVTEHEAVTGILSVSDIVRYYSDLVPLLRPMAGLTPSGTCFS